MKGPAVRSIFASTSLSPAVKPGTPSFPDRPLPPLSRPPKPLPTGPSSRTPARDTPPGGLRCPKPGPFGHRELKLRETDQLLPPAGKLPFTSFPRKPQLFDQSEGFSEFTIHA
ncbi:hypothetical protein CapIbe_012119 [Capra ibex]